MARTLVLLNRRSGTISDLWHDGLTGEIAAWFAEAGMEVTVEAVEPDALATRLPQLAHEAWDNVIVGGGDGTISSAAQHLQNTPSAMGILPFGTLNLAARDIAMPLDPRQAAIALASAVATPVDFLEVNGRPCLCVTILGFYPAMQLRRESYHGQRWWVKALQTVYGTLRSFTKYPAVHFEMREGDRRWTVSTRFAVFANNGYDDVLGILPRKTSFDQGYLTAYISAHKTRLGVARACLAYLFGRARNDPGLMAFQAHDLVVTARRRKSLPIMVDGEIFREPLPLVLHMRPAALRLLIPTAPTP
jgi:diacylglycerol kinase family enzyme